MEKKLAGSQDSRGDIAEDSAEKRRKFDRVQPVEVSTEEAMRIPRDKDFKENVLNWLKSKGVLGAHRNSDRGWDIIVGRRSIKNVVGHGAHEDKTALLEHVPKLIKDGVYLESALKKNGLNSHVFAAKATIDGRDYTVGFVVTEDRSGKRYYDHEIWVDLANEKRAERRSRKPSSAEAEPQTDGSLPEDERRVFDVVRKHIGNNNNITNSGIKSKGKDKNLFDPAADGLSDTPQTPGSAGGHKPVDAPLGVPCR